MNYQNHLIFFFKMSCHPQSAHFFSFLNLRSDTFWNIYDSGNFFIDPFVISQLEIHFMH
jgi:hypothetical protein